MTVQASDGTQLPVENLPVAIAYSGSFISTLTVQYEAISLPTPNLSNFVQTFTNNGTNITNISRWVLT